MKYKWMTHLIRFSIAVGITALLSPFQLDLLESATYDYLQRFSPKPDTSGQIVLLPISHKTLEALQREPEALDWALVLKKLEEAKPRQTVTLINPSTVHGSFDDLSVMAGIATQLPLIFGENDLPKTGMNQLNPLPAPFEPVEILPAPKTADRAVMAKDGVTRRMILSYEGNLTLQPRLAKTFNGISKMSDYSGVFSLLDSEQLRIRYRTPGSYPKYEFVDVLEGRVDPKVFENKTVFIGRDTLEAAGDYVTTPLSKDLLALSALEMQANSLDTLIKDDAPIFLPDWVRLVLTFLISILTVYVVMSLRPTEGLLLLGLSAMTYILAAWTLFNLTGWVMPLAHPLVALFIGYYFVIPYRLIVENRKSWEYYQKNRLLTQVEELKSNFMRMMSHDLKTPLARIQGMTELIGKDRSSLSEQQSEALDRITESSHELTEFIGSILSLSRIESKDMKLDRHSRDVNQILKQAIRKFEHTAHKKNIRIHTELEPLFSVKVDASLLETVFCNIIENAIKYSPEDSQVLISSEEIGDQVVIQVADQGPGISQNELQTIFERFYRGEQLRQTTLGNGLGLYLARYFVELHNGSIEAESVLGSGSTFTIKLPIDLNPPAHPADQKGERHAEYTSL